MNAAGFEVADIVDKAFASNGSLRGGSDITGVEGFFDAIGMMRGEYAPFLRFGFGFVFPSALLWLVRPGFAFASNGRPLPWSAVSQHPGATALPWWTFGILGAVVCSVFV
jgi:hypothetical protein